MARILHEGKQVPAAAPPSEDAHGFSLSDSSATLLIAIIVLSGIFFVSSLFHLVVRFLLCAGIRNSDEIEDDLTALQGRLHQLFDLHDSGVNQSFIDALPVFDYEAILGKIEGAPFDCAVCLCEFGGEDKLRLLPKCSHAFHVDCIDTWLLSHSSCPLCRAGLGDDLPLSRTCCVMVLESRNGSSRFRNADGSAAPPSSPPPQDEIESEAGECDETLLNSAERFVHVKLGKFKAVDYSSSGAAAESGAEARRCVSMGSFAYVIDGDSNPSSLLKVPVKLTRKSGISRGSSSLRIPMQRYREFNGIESFRALDEAERSGDVKGSSSFRFPIHRNLATAAETPAKNCGEENGSSFGRRTLFWLLGKNKEAHDSSSTNA